MIPHELLKHCLVKPGTWQDNPGDHDFPVVKIAEPGKIFAFVGAGSVGVRSGPNRVVANEWLERYPDDASVMAYIGRSGWNSLAFGGAIPDEEIVEAVDESYLLVVSKLPKRHRPTGWDS